MIKKILLIEPKSPDYHVFSKFTIPRLGLPQIGTILKKKGYRVKIILQELEKKKNIDYGKIRRFKPDIVGISTITSTAPIAYVIAKKIKDLFNIPVVFGGAHPSFMPEESLMHGDYVIRKEGDISFLQLIESLDNGISLESVPNLSFKNKDGFIHNPESAPICNLDQLPNPDLRLIDNYDKLKIIPISTSRGCPYGCRFCSVIKMFGRGYRFKSNKKIIQDMKQYPGKPLFMVDDNFTADKNRARELLRLMIRNDINNDWSAQVRTDIYGDEELLSLMKKTNCTHVYVGFESINPDSLNNCNKRQTVEDIEKAIAAVHKHDISIHGMFVFGFDSDTKETIHETVRFAKRLDIDTVQFMILTPLPGTDTYYELERENRIFYKRWESYDAHHAVFNPKNITAYDLQVETVKAMNNFYSLYNSISPVLSLSFVLGAASFGLRRLETYLCTKLKRHRHIRPTLTFFPSLFSRYVSKNRFYNFVSRTFGWVTTRKYAKNLKMYINNILQKA
ncbi:B12-binding domain-containing radical SAM protein [Candidatus Woesearchaeota archaeon]|nr:B12-binding domain-containing radical SAM protein [Candidatus Woesearchaeota archaeon]